jgi:hypothetical protein
VPWPYSTGPSRGAAVLDGWLPPGAWKLEHHSLDLSSDPEATLGAIEGVRLQDVPIVSLLFGLRGLPFEPEGTLGRFFTTSPFLMLGGERGQELVFGVVGPFWQWRRGKVPPRIPRTPEEFRAALAEGRMAAIGNFRAEPTPGGSRLWTETWVHAPRRSQRAFFTAYWLLVGPFSAWIRRLLLGAAQRRVAASATVER